MASRDVSARPAKGAGKKGHAKPSAPAAGGGSEIDDIFGALSAKRAAKPPPPPAAAAAAAAAAEPSEKARGKKRRAREEPRARAAAGGPDARGDSAPAERERYVGSSGRWESDGLGGVYDADGWTGRRTDEGMRIFKTHLLQPTKKKKSGGTPLCPFDCDCCYI